MSDTNHAPAPANNGGQAAEPSIADLMNFDPFSNNEDGSVEFSGGEKPAEKKGEQPGQDDGNKQVQEQKPDPAPKAPAQTPPTPATQGQAPDVAAQSIAALRDAVTALTSSQQRPDTEKKGPEKPKFDFAIPDVIVKAIRSEDPAEAALGIRALVNGMANAIHQDYMQAVQQQFSNVGQVVQQYVQVQAQQQAMVQDFYGTYPELQKPEIMPFVAQTAQQVAQEIYAQTGVVPPWPTIRDNTAQRLKSLGLGGAPQQQPQTPLGASEPSSNAEPITMR